MVEVTFGKMETAGPKFKEAVFSIVLPLVLQVPVALEEEEEDDPPLLPERLRLITLPPP